MNHDFLEEYLNRNVCIHFTASPHSSLSQEDSGLLIDYSTSGILILHEEYDEVFIPFTAIRMVQIKPKPTFWQRFTGTD